MRVHVPYHYRTKNHQIQNLKSEKLGALCVICSAIMFGGTPLLTLTTYHFGSNPFTTVFGRFLTGSLILAVIIVLSPKLSFRLSRQQLGRIAILSVMFSATVELLFTSYPIVGSGLGTMLHFTYPIAVIVILALFFQERPTPIKLFCAALCITGILCLYTPDASNTKNMAFGMALALASGVTFALYIVLLGKSGLSDIPVLEITFWLSFFSMIPTGIFALCSGKFIFNLGWQAWLAHAALGFITSALATTLLQKGIFLCGEVKASLLSNLEPFTATIIGVLVFQETLTLRTGTGMICILAAAILTSKK